MLTTRNLSIAMMLGIPRLLAAQSFLDDFSYDGLGFAGIGFDVGAIASDDVTTELSGGIRIDFGMFSPKVRMMFGANYFKGDLKLEEIRRFERRLSGIVIDPTGDAIVDIGLITWANFETTVDFQYLLSPNDSKLVPYVGIGVGIHIRNGSGAAIDGTFVEDALDTIAAGVNAVAGFEFRLTERIWFTTEARGGLTSELLLASLRGGFMYRILPGAGG